MLIHKTPRLVGCYDRRAQRRVVLSVKIKKENHSAHTSLSPFIFPATHAHSQPSSPPRSPPRPHARPSPWLTGWRGSGKDGSAADTTGTAPRRTRSQPTSLCSNRFAFTFSLCACESMRRLPLCHCDHGQIMRCGFGSDVVVKKALLKV
jgi:hypothetical protein